MPELTITNASIALVGLVTAAGCLYLLYRLLVAAARAGLRSARRFSLTQLRRSSVLVVGSAGLLAAAYGTVRALHAMGQPLPLALATSAAIEGGAIYLAADLYIRAREGRPALRPRLASWGYALASAWANATHPPTPDTSWTGALIFGLVPLLGLYLIEYQAHTDRARGHQEITAWPLRVAAAAWRRGWTAAATWLGVDVNASDTDTERELAARRAARATYRLRLAQQAGDSERKIRRLTRASQAARERAGVASDPRQALRLAVLMRELVHGPEHAAGDWSDVTASASRVYGGLLLAGPDGIYDLSGRTLPAGPQPVRPVRAARRSTRELEADRGPDHPRPTPKTQRPAEPAHASGPGGRSPDVQRSTPDDAESDLIQRAVDELGADLSKRTLMEAVRSAGGRISSDRAAEIARQVKAERTGMHVVRGEADREEQTG